MTIKKNISAAGVAKLLIDNAIDFEYFSIAKSFDIPMYYGDIDRIVYSDIQKRWLIDHDGEIEKLTTASFDSWKVFVNRKY